MTGRSFSLDVVAGSRSLTRPRSGLFLLLLALAACAPPPPPGNDNGNDNDNAAVEPLFPANYRTTYMEVRDCRFSSEHASTIRVWVNDVGLAAYRADADPLPVGTIVVKEEFQGSGCENDDELFLWSVMRKEAPGFDAEDNDWSWQDVTAPNRRVRINSKTTCVECHREPECAVRDYMCTVP